MTASTKPISSALNVFKTLDVLSRDFFYGFSNAELADATGFDKSAVTRHIVTLLEAGYAERIESTGRYRCSHNFARKASNILTSLANAEHAAQESLRRIQIKG